MSAATADRVYPEAEATAWLAAHLPHWAVQDGAITRTYRTAGWRATLMVVNTIGHLAEAAWHHPDLAVSYPSVTVRLSTHDAGGITDKDLQLARKIEEVVLWQPARDGGALPGPPPSDAYIRYD